MSTKFIIEHYNKQSSNYEAVHAFTKRVAQQTISLARELNSKSIVLDNACGPGIVTEQLVEHFKKNEDTPAIHSADLSPGMIEVLQSKIKQNHRQSVSAVVMDAQDLKYEDDMFTHSFTNFGIFLVPDAEKAAKEIYRTLQPGGQAIVTSWAHLDWLVMIQDVQQRVNPASKTWGGPFGSWLRTEKLRKTMADCGFGSDAEHLTLTEIEETLEGEERDDYLASSVSSLSRLVTEGWSEEKREDFRKAFIDELELVKREDRKMRLGIAVALAMK